MMVKFDFSVFDLSHVKLIFKTEMFLNAHFLYDLVIKGNYRGNEIKIAS